MSLRLWNIDQDEKTQEPAETSGANVEATSKKTENIELEAIDKGSEETRC